MNNVTKFILKIDVRIHLINTPYVSLAIQITLVVLLKKKEVKGSNVLAN